MQAVPAFHNGFLINYAPARTNWRQVVTSIAGLTLADLTDEELEDYLADYRELARDAISERKKLDQDIAIYEYEAQSAIETLQEREKCRADKKRYCRDLLTHVATGVR